MEALCRGARIPASKKIGFDRLTRLAVSNQGFASVGKPEFGRFKLVHTNPDFSTSGLSAVVAEYYAATGKREGLTEREVTASAARQKVKDIERSIVHYGDTTLFIADQMRPNGPGLRLRGGDGGGHAARLQPPPRRPAAARGALSAGGHVLLRQPLHRRSTRPTTRAAEKEGARKFQKFLEEEIGAEEAGREGFRPADLKEKPAGRVTAANGADPAQPQRVLGLPEPRVLDRIRKTWRADRKPANVLLVVDTSGSMNDENRLARAKAGTAHVPARGVAERPHRPDHLLRPDPAAGAHRASSAASCRPSSTG